MIQALPNAGTAVRLSAGILLNIVIFHVGGRLAFWSSLEREFRLWFVTSIVSAVALVLLFRVLWHGKPWQRVCAALLMILPCFGIYEAFEVMERYK